ncbi:uncharacterized protein PHALS_00781 [Plasmopara halstedii]|uniref:Uncharacterized protein n=1 Tax=Plasmopara halstedii TaxID=4781 RepID=A0A0P1AS07_PLAHL|nr:uncharacterized protein PHALS_00781 [Plasmopara halstedii]CEG44413.1 hypothetical protein PHALS_00781 [Plasmopara halstedii]|eukprot:XP_024580782.1 hypothetical protein PHALS_00781 [Plasmopara halstedii]
MLWPQHQDLCFSETRQEKLDEELPNPVTAYEACKAWTNFQENVWIGCITEVKYLYTVSVSCGAVNLLADVKKAQYQPISR